MDPEKRSCTARTDWTEADEQFVRTLIRRTLNELSVDIDGRGGTYLCEILELLLRDPSRIEKLSEPMKDTADRYGILPESVRSSIRSTLVKAWIKGDPEVQYRYFSNTVSFKRGKPTESNFLITIAMHLRHELDEYFCQPGLMEAPELL